MHSHKYVGTTSYENGHVHHYKGMTSCDMDTPGHIHYMSGQTSLDDGHTHNYKSPTGPAIYADGKHYHLYCGVTDVADQHVHQYNGSTFMYYALYYKNCCPSEKAIENPPV